MTIFKWLAYLTLALAALAALAAEPHCPGNVASLRLRPVHGSQAIVPVMINHTGPYDFLVDTGTQVTIVDASLADALHLERQGDVEVVGVGFLNRAPVSQLDSLSVGSQATTNPVVVVQNLGQLHKTDLHIRGILGGNFLKHFDVLIDYRHGVLCLDDANVMRPTLRGERIALVKPPQTNDQAIASMPLVIAVHLSGVGRPLLLEVDSGATVPFLFEPARYLAPGLVLSPTMNGLSADGMARPFVFLSPQNMRIGGLTLFQISFATLSSGRTDAPNAGVDGLLTTGLFRSIYISYADRFVVLDPW